MVDTRYIREYPGNLTPEEAAGVIEVFEWAEARKLVVPRANDLLTFDELNVSAAAMHEPCNRVHEFFAGKLHTMMGQYRRDCHIASWQWPAGIVFEHFRIKRYQPGVGRFGPHVDAIDQSRDRFLVYFWYLNTVEEGGETAFLGGPSVKPEVGKLLMFPPLWTYPHEGRVPVSGQKFIVGGYLHFAPKKEG